MKVTIKEFNVDMEVKNKGIELDVCEPDGTHIGDLIVTKTNLIWCQGKTSAANGKSISWKKFIELMNAS